MTIQTLDLNAAVCGLFTSMLALPISVADEFADTEVHGASVTGVISISGDWNGAVVVTVPMPLARQISAAMFALDADALTEAEVQDAIGELANMVGGATKAMLGGSSSVSLPSVTEGVRYRVSIPGAREIANARFDCSGYPLCVSVVQGASKGSANAKRPA